MKKTQYENQPFPIPEMSDHPPEGCPFKMGDKVRFVNVYGVVFGPYEVQGFVLPGDEVVGNRTVYLDYDCYWFPTEPASLTIWSDEMAEQVKRGYLLDSEKPTTGVLAT